jgi:hypothetical protein
MYWLFILWLSTGFLLIIPFETIAKQPDAIKRLLWPEPSPKVFSGYLGRGRAVWGVGLCRLVAGIVGSNPAQGMDVCPRLSVLCCPV